MSDKKAQNGKKPKISTTVTLAPDIHFKLVRLAHEDNRNLSNYLETLIMKTPLSSPEKAA